MNLVKNFLRKVKNKLVQYTRLTSEEYVEQLRSKGVQIGENVLFRYPDHTIIDVTRPSLVELGNNLDINDNFTLLTHH